LSDLSRFTLENEKTKLLEMSKLLDTNLAGSKEMLSGDLQSPPGGLEREIIDEIKSMSGVDS